MSKGIYIGGGIAAALIAGLAWAYHYDQVEAPKWVSYSGPVPTFTTEPMTGHIYEKKGSSEHSVWIKNFADNNSPSITGTWHSNGTWTNIRVCDRATLGSRDECVGTSSMPARKDVFGTAILQIAVARLDQANKLVYNPAHIVRKK
ncbi:MAG: hypothetical protein JWO84_392 [Parcubacteria group bacterium]|nr:hypothetical protein [Parcubacteria group bacterium]